MEYKIIGSTMPVAECSLRAGETLQCQAGAMKYMDDGITMKTGMQGGLGGFFKRRMTGESGFLNYYTAERNGAVIGVGHTFPGTILPLDVGAASYVCQKRTFLAGESEIDFEVVIQRKLGVGMFGGEGFVMQKLSGRGTALLEIDGELIERKLASGEVLKVESGALALMESTVSMDIERVKGVSNFLFGGEGLFLTTLTGPGTVWLQTMSIQSLAGELIPFLPKSGNSK